jgi:fibronectin type 3 domain-containing protein
LTWSAASASTVVGYRVYYGTAPSTYIQTRGSGIYAGFTTTFTVTGLKQGTLYYFAVTAVDAMGNESGYSNEALKKP